MGCSAESSLSSMPADTRTRTKTPLLIWRRRSSCKIFLVCAVTQLCAACTSVRMPMCTKHRRALLLLVLLPLVLVLLLLLRRLLVLLLLVSAPPPHLGVDLVQTADAHHKCELCLRLHIEATLDLGLALQADGLTLLQRGSGACARQQHSVSSSSSSLTRRASCHEESKR